MKRSLVSTIAICGGGLMGLAATRLRPRPQSRGDAALNRLTTYFIVPVWIGAGFLDYIWHRRTRIETTSGIEESLMHSLMMLEAGPAVLAPLFLEINAGVLGGMVALGIAHELTVLWDVCFTSSRRPISAGEQVTPHLPGGAAVSGGCRRNRHPLGAIPGAIPSRAGNRTVRNPVARSGDSVTYLIVSRGCARALRRPSSFRRVTPLRQGNESGRNRPGFARVPGICLLVKNTP